MYKVLHLVELYTEIDDLCICKGLKAFEGILNFQISKFLENPMASLKI